MDEKKSFVLYTDLRGPLEFLSDEELGRLFRAIMDYADGGSVPEFSGALGMGFAFVRAQLDRNDAKWQQTRAKRSEAGRAGARARAAAQEEAPQAPSGKAEAEAHTAAQEEDLRDAASKAQQNEQMLDLLDGVEQTQAYPALNVPVPVPVNVPVPVPAPVPVPVNAPAPDPVGEDAFGRFWAAYPRKEGKKDAKEAFSKVTVDTDVLLQALDRQKRSDRWKKEGGRYVPNAAAWLRGARWEDEPPPSGDGFIHTGEAFSPMMVQAAQRLLREHSP